MFRLFEFHLMITVIYHTAKATKYEEEEEEAAKDRIHLFCSFIYFFLKVNNSFKSAHNLLQTTIE